MRVSQLDLERIEAVKALENVDRTALLKDFIEDGLRHRVIQIYKQGKITATRGAELLQVPLRVFLELLEEDGIPVNWDSENIKEYMKSHYKV